MTSPFFSIVIPTHNRSDLVQGAIRSVLRQTFDDLEVVVSDNCSQDDTRDVVQGFADPRVRYARTSKYAVIADSWEFARSQARGKLVMMLSDDDALVHDALARFAEEHERHDAQFLFCNEAEYRDKTFVGDSQNTVQCGPFSGKARVVTTEEFLRPLFAFRPAFPMHPTNFMFESCVAEQVVRRCGRFFKTNGVEYFAWPLAAVFSKHVVHIDAPLVILGRTAKSWGSTVVLSNPGKEQIQKMIAGADQNRDWVPLDNFTLCNLMAEGLLLGKKLFPEELQSFPFDEQQYLKATMRELRRRRDMGVDVDREMNEALEYADKYPSLKAELLSPESNGRKGRDSTVRKIATTVGLLQVSRRVRNVMANRKIERGEVNSGFNASGRDFGFNDALGCADFISRVSSSATIRAHHQ